MYYLQQITIRTRQCKNKIDLKKTPRQFYQDRALVQALS